MSPEDWPRIQVVRRRTVALIALSAIAVAGLFLSSVASADPAPPVLVPAEVTLLPANAIPAHPTDPDGAAVELGVRFTADSPGKVTGLRFFKGCSTPANLCNTGTHVGHLWSSGGALLATVTFVNETASGWQTAYFPARIALTPGATYVVSYFAPKGHYAGDGGGFAAPLDNAPLHAPANAGVYHYGTPTGFPTSTFGASNYYVDPIFMPGQATTATTATTTSTTEATTTTGPATTTTTEAPTTTTTAPAAGITLRPVDGGPGYYGQWSNSLPTDPGFFPISVWAETLANPASDTARYKNLGVNGFVNVWDGMTPAIRSALTANGQWAFADPGSPTAASSYGNEWAGYQWFDEPDGQNQCSGQWMWEGCTTDGQGRTTPASIQAAADNVREADPTRPTFGQYTKPVAMGSGLSDAQRRAYVAAVDVVSMDVYCMTDPWLLDADAHLWKQADIVGNVRALAGQAKPVWAFIETSRVFSNGRVAPTPAQIQAETWAAIIGGARGIEYFNHNFTEVNSDPGQTQHLLIDSRYAAVANAVSQTNAQIKALAPVINAPYADGAVTGSSGQINSMIKAGPDGAYYLFVGSRQTASQQFTVQLNPSLAGLPVSVLNEGRSLTLNGSTLTDTLAGETAVHIYKIG